MVMMLVKMIEDDDEVLEKMLEEQTVEYDRKVDLGEKVYKILGRGKVKQAALSKDMQKALELYEMENKDFDLYKMYHCCQRSLQSSFLRIEMMDWLTSGLGFRFLKR